MKDTERARNVWLAALKRWDEVEQDKEESNNLGCERILVYLGQLELDQGNYSEAVRRFQEAKAFSPSPEALEERIQEIRPKLTTPAPNPSSAPH